MRDGYWRRRPLVTAISTATGRPLGYGAICVRSATIYDRETHTNRMSTPGKRQYASPTACQPANAAASRTGPGQVRPGRRTTRHRAVSARAELSSVATAVDELAKRVATIGEGLSGDEREALSTDLFEVERALGNAARRLARALGDR